MRNPKRPYPAPFATWCEFVDRKNWRADWKGTLCRRWRSLRLRIAWRRGGLFWWHTITNDGGEHRVSERGYKTEPLAMEALADALLIAKPPKPPEWERYCAEQNGDQPPQSPLPGH